MLRFSAPLPAPELIAIATGPDKMQTTAIAKDNLPLADKVDGTERFLAFP